jgi:hypothetical protein
MAPHSLLAASNLTSKGKSKHLASLGSLAPNWIAKILIAAAPQMPQLTLKLHAQPGLCLQHNHQQQIP